VSPNLPLGHLKIGEIFTVEGKYSDALHSYQKALQISPKYAMVHVALGRLYLAMSKEAEATLEFQAAVGLDPKFSEAYHELGKIYEKAGQHSESREAFENAQKYSSVLDEAGSFMTDLERPVDLSLDIKDQLETQENENDEPQ
jgi:predicted Zn-dependent protease